MTSFDLKKLCIMDFVEVENFFIFFLDTILIF